MVRDREPQQPMIEITGWANSAPPDLLESGLPPRAGRRVPGAALAILVVLIAWLAVPSHHSRRPTGPTGTTAAPADVTGHGPSQAIMAAFAMHVPGSVVVSEHTVREVVRGRPVVERRWVNAVTGNVVMKVRIGLAGAGRVWRQTARRISRHGYVIDFSFVGFYPPSRAELQALASDARLTSVLS